MSEDNKSGLSEAASAAKAVVGAVKAGKAVAGAAKGAAVGGPYGAAAGFLWENRKTVDKIIAAFAALLILPLLFIMMLPSIIFGDMSAASATGDASPIILNDDIAIHENIEAVATAIGEMLNEGAYDVATRIEADFASSGKDRYEIVNPHESPSYSVNLFMSQYCAAKNEDYTSISVADLKSILRSAKSDLYSFSFADEQREVVAEATPTPGTDESSEPAPAEPVYEQWRIYTVIYNGETYFADAVFKLSDDQKRLARDYAQNLALYLNDGSVQYLDLSGYGSVSYEGVVFGEGETAVVYYNQGDVRYKDAPYGLDNIGGYGCGPTSMAIVISTLTSETVDPVQMAKWSYDNKYWYSGGGSYHALIPAAAEAWGLPVEGCTDSEPQRIVDALSSGKLIVAIMAKGHFTKKGHFIVLRGVTSDGMILVADPGSHKRSEQEWDLSIILDEARKDAGANGPFWIIG